MNKMIGSSSSIKIKESLPRRIYIVLSTIFLIGLCILMVAPLIKVIAESFSSKQFVESGQVLFWPKGFSLLTYEAVLTDRGIRKAFFNSVFITAVGTAVNVFMTALMAYPLSRKEFIYRRQVLLMVTITLIFSAPLIPNYLLIRGLGMDNSFLAVIVPGAISGFNLMVMKSFFANLPGELIDASRIDGCSETGLLFRIVLPLAKPSIAAVSLFYGVGHWNSLQGPLMYLRKANLQTLQIRLYQMIQANQTNFSDMVENFVAAPQSIKATTIVVATVPILLVYPFLQKHFVQGATLGSVKE